MVFRLLVLWMLVTATLAMGQAPAITQPSPESAYIADAVAGDDFARQRLFSMAIDYFDGSPQTPRNLARAEKLFRLLRPAYGKKLSLYFSALAGFYRQGLGGLPQDMKRAGELEALVVELQTQENFDSLMTSGQESFKGCSWSAASQDFLRASRLHRAPEMAKRLLAERLGELSLIYYMGLHRENADTKRAAELLTEARRNSEQAGSVLAMRGLVAYLRGNFSECLTLFNEAEKAGGSLAAYAPELSRCRLWAAYYTGQLATVPARERQMAMAATWQKLPWYGLQLALIPLGLIWLSLRRPDRPIGWVAVAGWIFAFTYLRGVSQLFCWRFPLILGPASAEALGSLLLAMAGGWVVYRRAELRALYWGRWPASRRAWMLWIAMILAGAFVYPLASEATRRIYQWSMGHEPPIHSYYYYLEDLEKYLGLNQLVWLLVDVAILGPFCEELTVRGFLLDALERRFPRHWAAVISAGVFGLMHRSIVFFASYVIFGLLASSLRRSTGNLRASWGAHMLTNASICFRHIAAVRG